MRVFRSLVLLSSFVVLSGCGGGSDDVGTKPKGKAPATTSPDKGPSTVVAEDKEEQVATPQTKDPANTANLETESNDEAIAKASDSSLEKALAKIRKCVEDGDEILNLNDLQLKALPSQIGSLPNLTELELRNNKLTSLPPEIGKLAKLELLDLYGNKLTGLPPEIGELKNLNLLCLRSNQLTDCRLRLAISRGSRTCIFMTTTSPRCPQKLATSRISMS